MGCDNCDRLKREIRELREELEEWRTADGEVVDSETHDVAKKLGVRPQAAKLLLSLLSSPGKTVPIERLARAIGYHGDDISRMVSMAAHSLRSGGVPIETVWGIGRRVRVEDVDRIRAML